MHPGHLSKKRRILREYGTKALSLTSSISKLQNKNDVSFCAAIELDTNVPHPLLLYQQKG